MQSILNPEGLIHERSWRTLFPIDKPFWKEQGINF